MELVEERVEPPFFDSPSRDVIHVFRCPVCQTVVVRTAPPKGD
jgi:hypothetical protein